MMGALLLCFVALIWGGAFLAQKLGMASVGPFAFTVYRNVLAALFLTGVIAVRNYYRARTGGPVLSFRQCFGRVEWWGGFCCGISLFIAMMLQQLGILDTTPGECAFLTTNYVLAVPLLSLFLGRLPRGYVWLGVVLSIVGTYLICVKGGAGFVLGRGQILSLLCAVGFGIQILIVDRFVHRSDVLALCCIQFTTCAVAGLPFLALPTEWPMVSFANIAHGAGAIAFCGILSSGVAYTLQNVGQKMTPPSLAAILMSLESVFSATFGWWFLGDVLTPRQLLGCALVFSAVALTQVCEAVFGPSKQSASAA